MRVRQRIREVLRRIPGIGLVRPGWPDEARLVVQTPVFARLLAGEDPRGACLNAGCGEGLFLRFLGSFDGLTRIVHMDLTKLDLTNRCNDPRHETVIGSVTRIPFGDDEFGFVFCTEVLEHIEDDNSALEEIARVLSPGGLALLSTPTPPAPPDAAHVREGYTLEELREKLAMAGFDVVAHDYCFHRGMRTLLNAWRWFGDKPSIWLPRAVVLAFGYVDRFCPIGKPWDIVVLARKSS